MKIIQIICILAFLIFTTVIEARPNGSISINGDELLPDNHEDYFASRRQSSAFGNWVYDNHGLFAQIGFFGGGVGLTSGTALGLLYLESQGGDGSLYLRNLDQSLDQTLDFKILWNVGGYVGALPGVVLDWSLCKTSFGLLCSGRKYRN